MKRIAFSIATTSLAILSQNSAAQSESLTACNGALVQNVNTANISIAERLSILSTLSKDDFESRQKSLQNGTTALIGGIPFTSDTKWDEFDKKRSTFFSQYQSDFSYNQYTYWNQVYLPQLSVDAYTKCLQTLRPVGPRIWVNKAEPTENDVSIHIQFNTASGDASKRSINLNQTNGKFSIDDNTRRRMANFTGTSDFDVIFVRTNISQSATITINVGGMSDVITIPKNPAVKEAKTERKGFSKDLSLNAPNSDQQVSGSSCIPETASDVTDIEDFKFVPALSGATVVAMGGIGDENATVSMNTPDKVCGSFHVGADSWGHGHSVTFRISAVGERVRWVPYGDGRFEVARSGGPKPLRGTSLAEKTLWVAPLVRRD